MYPNNQSILKPSEAIRGELSSSSYDSSNIKILTSEETQQFDYILVANLADKYKKSVEFIQRGVEACRLAGVSVEDYFIPRYLEADLSIPVNQDVSEISKELQKEARG